MSPVVGLHGAGMIAVVHAMAAAAAGFRLGPVASRTAARAAERAARFGGRAVPYDALPAEAEVVVVASPPGDHAAAAARLLAAGATVVVEKPLCTTLADADALAAADAAAGGRLVYGENLVFAPSVRSFLAGRDGLGPLQHLSARALQGRPDWGDFLTPGWGGGVLFDLGAHPIALVLLVGAPARPVAVQAELRAAPDHPTDDDARARIRFDSGLVATVEASWRHGPGPQWDLEAAGAHGVARLELFPEPVLERNGGPVPLPPARTTPAAIDQYGYFDQLRHAAAVARGAAAPLVGLGLGRLVLEVTMAAYASAGAGGVWVPLPVTDRPDVTPLQRWRS
jgi:predicted dehydrogenase